MKEELLKNERTWLFVPKERKLYEIEREVVIQSMVFRLSWIVGLKNMELFKDA